MKKEKNQQEIVDEEIKETIKEQTEEIKEQATEEKSELDLLNEQIKDLNEKLLRSYAEFDNYKKRTLKEKQEMSVYAKILCIKEMLVVIDNFERALDCECKDEEFKKGMEMIFNQIQDSLKKLGVIEIEALNKPFDPEIHNAINQVQDENFGENTVCQVLQKGYKIEDKVVRHAMVIVANP